MVEDELVTLTDIASRLGVSSRAVRGWRDGYPDWPMSVGTVVRAGRRRTAYRWAQVEEFCFENGLPDRERQEGVRRARSAREEEQ